MMGVLIQNRLKKALGGKTKKPASMTDGKALSTIQLCLAPHVPCEVLNKTTTIELPASMTDTIEIFGPRLFQWPVIL